MTKSNFQYTPPRKKERRRSPRLRIDPLVYARLAPDNGGILLDISDGGISISLANPQAVTSQVRFSLTLGERAPVEGIGQIVWVSESGRHAGVKFIQFSDEARERIKKWLSAENVQASVDNQAKSPAQAKPVSSFVHSPDSIPAPARQTAAAAGAAAAAPPERETPDTASVSSVQEGKKTPSSSLLSPPAPRPDAMSAEQPPPAEGVPEAAVHFTIPETPLFFLPPKRESEADPSDESSELFANSLEKGAQPASNGPESDSLVFRTALVSASNVEKDGAKGKAHPGKILLGTLLCALLLAGAIAYHSYPGMFSQFQLFPSPDASGIVSRPVVEARSRRVTRRVRRRRFFPRDERDGKRIGHVTIYYSPSPGQVGIAPVFTETVPVGSPAPATKQSSTSTQAPSTSSPGLPALFAENDANPSPKLEASAPLLNLRAVPQGPGEDLRSDGALVEEGSPISTPLNVGSYASVSKPIVVEAVIAKDGSVRNVHLISSPSSQLAQAVLQAVKQWRYRPFYSNGEPVEFTTRITFDFSAPSGKP